MKTISPWPASAFWSNRYAWQLSYGFLFSIDGASSSCGCVRIDRPTSDCADEVTLVSQRRKEPNTRPQASFDRNEGENARRPWPRTARRAGKEARRGVGATDGDVRGPSGHQQLAWRTGAGLRCDPGERDAALRGQVRHALSL